MILPIFRTPVRESNPNHPTFMIFGMADEKMSEGEASPAQVASERLLPRVHALVVLQLVGLGKCFAAYWAGMRSALATVHLGRKKGGNSWQLLLLTEDLSERKLSPTQLLTKQSWNRLPTTGT